jgi:long-subunit acyl-CoA synthetase (AMP-forming)
VGWEVNNDERHLGFTMASTTVFEAEPFRPLTTDDLPLARLYRHERERGEDLYLVQPVGDGEVVEYTFARAMAEARRMARFLLDQGYEPGSRIGVLSKNIAQHVIFDIAIWMAGHVSVSIYPTAGAETLEYVLEHCEATMLFVGKLDDASAISAVPEGIDLLRCRLSPPVVGAKEWKEIIESTSPLQGTPDRGLAELCMLMYTSGSTGAPKGVEHTFASASAFGHSVYPVVGVGADDRIISYLPYAHAFERAAIEVPSMIYGFRLYFVESLATFLDDVKRARPTIFQSVPRLWLKFKAGVEAKMNPDKLSLLLRMPLVGSLVKKKVLGGLGLDATRFGFTGSAPIPGEVLEWYRRLGLEMLEGYGMSENASLSNASRPGDARAGTVGPPAVGVSIRIAEDGEIQVKSPGMMTRYFKDEAQTAEAFTDDGWLRTGDRGSLDTDGHLRITGRVKELFKTSKAKYIAPAPIENKLNCTDLIEQSCVMGSGMPQPFAAVMLSEEAQAKLRNGARATVLATLERALAQTNETLASHERLDQLVVASEAWNIGNGLLTPSLKIKRAAIEERYEKFADEAALKRQAVRVEGG